MRGSQSPLKICFLGLVIFFLGSNLWAAFEIDMATPTTKESLSKPVSDLTKNSLEQQNATTQNQESNPAERVVNQVNLSSEDPGTKVSFNGNNLPKPSVDKVSSGRIVIKFANTSLKIPSKINEEDQIVKDIRSAPHPGSAWLVLDVHGVKKLKLQKTEQGYELLLNTTQSSSETFSEENSTQTTPQKSAPNEKGIFYQLIDASLKPTEDSIKLVLTSDGPSKYTVRKLSQPEKIIIHFQNTKLQIADKLKHFKGDDPELQKGGLLGMELRQIGPQYSPISEVMLTVLPGTINQIDKELNQIIITLTAPPTIKKMIEKKGNLNQLVTMDLQNADLNAVVKTLASESGFELNLVSGAVTGVVNEKFKDVPLKTALSDMLTPGGYNYEIQGNTLRVGPVLLLVSTKLVLPHVTELIAPTGGMTTQEFDTLVRPLLSSTNELRLAQPHFDTVRNFIVLSATPADIEDYKRAIRDLKLDTTTESTRITRVVKLDYADPTEVGTILTPYLTPVGKIQVSGYRLVIWETATNMGALLELISELDRKPPQVLIESNIVEVDNEADLNLGVNWSAIKSTGDPTVTGTVTLPPSSPQAIPGLITFGTVKSGFNINTTLQALETNKKGKIISRPRIATINGVAAEIKEIQNVIVSSTTQTIVPGGTFTITQTFTTLALPIDLIVTPRITDDGRITTLINASITSQTGQPQGTGAPPPTSVQTATTKITTKNGETIVIGGLVRDTVQDVTNGIPILSSIPILGTLFQEHDKQTRKEELVIFITPTLLED
jgi:type II secretory pathway component GspD/PulD (secretin)